jgi:hypothetical protein
MYIRKTETEYQLHVNYGYGHGWEHEISESSPKEIRDRRREYRENCPEYPTKIVVKRVPISKSPMLDKGMKYMEKIYGKSLGVPSPREI